MLKLGMGLDMGVSAPSGTDFFYDLGLAQNPTNAWAFFRLNDSIVNPMKGERSDDNEEKDIVWNTCTSEFVDTDAGLTYTMSTDEMDKKEFWQLNQGPCSQGTDWAGTGVSVLMHTLYDQFGASDIVQASAALMLKVGSANHLGGQSSYRAITGIDNSTLSGYLTGVSEIEIFQAQHPSQASTGLTVLGCSSLANGWRCRGDLWRIKEDSVNSSIGYDKLAEKQLCHYYWKAGDSMFFKRYTETNGTETTSLGATVQGGTLTGDLQLGFHATNSWPLTGTDFTSPPMILLGAWSEADRTLITNWWLRRFRFTFEI